MYDGEREKFEEFKEKVLLMLKGKVHLFSLEALKVIYIPSRLGEGAYNQVKRRLREDFFKPSKQLLDYLQKAVADSDPTRAAEAKLTELKQRNSSLSKDLASFCHLSEETTWDEAAKLHILKQSLSEELNDEFLHRDLPKTRQAFLEKVIEVDIQVQQWKNDCSSRPHPSGPVVPSAPRPVSGPPATGPSASHPSFTPGRVVPIDLSSAPHRLTDAETDQHRREGRCMYCSQPGQFVSVCPK